ncbi:hypothetical protein OH807_01425 [Kitasatospora sp. NBC_01560]|uniref:hypothetical protein n=1 Tax=Kitasatospora sp. NBC_01560 TaxID=2975965 RepID=UPI00386A3681
MNRRIRSVASRSTAIYLRCYPYDTGYLLDYWRVLAHYAIESGLGEATVFMDNGRRSTEPLAALEDLLHAVVTGICDTVLIPGPFVFSLDDAAAAAVIRRMEEAGCRVVEMPRPTSGRSAGDLMAVR